MVRRSEPYLTPENIEERSRSWLAEVRAAVRPRPHLTVAPASCALLVVDMIQTFAAPDGETFLPASQAILPPLTRLLANWHRRQGTVVFTRHGHDGPHDTGMLGTFFSDYIRWQSPGSQLVPELAPGPEDIILRKRTYDAFHETDLADRLRARGCRQVLVTGVLAHMCVATTARSAFVHGFETFLAVDAVATTNERLHLATLHTLADSVAVLVSSDEVSAL